LAEGIFVVCLHIIFFILCVGGGIFAFLFFHFFLTCWWAEGIFVHVLIIFSNFSIIYPGMCWRVGGAHPSFFLGLVGAPTQKPPKKIKNRNKNNYHNK